jgi:hypothetical protein
MTDKIIKEFLERNIIELFTSQRNATLFLEKDKCVDEEKRASKMCRMVYDF